MSNHGRGDDPQVPDTGWLGTHASELAPLGDVHSEAPQQYDPNLLSPEESTLQYERVPTPASAAPAAPIDPSVKKEIEQAITQALSRKGIGGTVFVSNNNAELHGVSAGVVAVDVGDWVSQWNLLPADMRDRRAEAAAVRLAAALGKVVKPKDGGSRIGPLIGKIVGFVTVVAVFGVVVWWLDDSGFFGSTPDETESGGVTTAATAASETPAAAKARRERACEAALSRLYSGASMGVDTDGFVVELWLARTASPSKLSDDPSLKDFGSKGAIDVGVKGDATADVVVDKDLSGLDSVIVRMKDGFVPPFFETAGRRQMESLAQSTASKTKAVHAALYARCAHLGTRDIGGWYFGRTKKPRARVDDLRGR